MTFSERLAKARKERGLTQSEVAEKLPCVLSGSQPVGEGRNGSGNG